ncbi:MAG TPA: XTP/dITP diphosphatase [Syntrophothermus lipocalidus]|uniref:dITP/XTP pyrophosphatase n=1 Tax=Syntrophothermus lipocalidus (strain DSM 12680 / TGB-C1) TaxID=643648 RepID=D7CIR8_SYNLT|nr:XTP/dITP diphosphatase [Syntrophothermus lipocalidus]ADI02796.1 non-canonical purine NTP pyrophosphatase, rdgB/HAM1 family [Syntrophothermus lipocalidus DSM 12680]HHV77522.1 XTP/dITP diphosphatase [Syntrophothermus lipocalidus]HOV43873.1 XTP/dITP diphosphatase [Syntrophothermus lipocalidus]
MERKLVLATRNGKKLQELKQLLDGMGVEMLSLEQFPEVPEVEEDGETFAENAIKKARTIAEVTGMVTLADDSGLEVDALGGSPGVHSARFAGEHGDDAANNAKLMDLMRGVPEEKRGARFRCVVAVAVPWGEVHLAEGTCEGKIAHEPRGDWGFGYDPLFVVEGYGRTMAELPPEVKNSISHRGRALERARAILASLWEGE